MSDETKTPTKPQPLPDVSKPAWEARFGKPLTPQQTLAATLPSTHLDLPDVSKSAWEARYGKPPAREERQ